MSLVLLDTHAWVWLLNGSTRLGPKARKAIQRSLADEALLISAISPWEVAMLVAKGCPVLDRDVGEWVQTALSIAATARQLGSTLITADQLLLGYGKDGHLKTLKAGQ